VTEEQRRSGQKAAQPFGREQFEASGCVARSLQVAANMRLARALPSAATCFPREPFQYFKSLPSFRKKGGVYTAEIGRSYRALARERKGHYYWFWIGTHEDYNKFRL